MNRFLTSRCFLFILLSFPAFSLAGCSPSSGEGFSLHLVTGVDDPRLVDEIGLEVVSLDSEPLFSEQDIVSFDLPTGEMELMPEAFTKVTNLFTLPIDVDGIPFVVLIDSERVFHGAFYSPASSLSFDGGVVLDPMSNLDHVLRFSFGYPGPSPQPWANPLEDARLVDWATNR